jgi:hypothetical protein
LNTDSTNANASAVVDTIGGNISVLESKAPGRSAATRRPKSPASCRPGRKRKMTKVLRIRFMASLTATHQ